MSIHAEGYLEPFEIGILAGTIPERIYHTWVADNQPDEKLLWSINHGLMQTLSFNPTPQAILPALEVIANRSFFFDKPIEGMSDEGKIPEARYGAHTSETMKQLGSWIGTSPKKLQHLFTGYTGTMGGYVLSLADIVTRATVDAPTQAAWGPEDYVLIKSFYRGSRPRSTQYHTDFYDRMNEVSELHRTYRAWIKEGRTEDARRLRRENKDKLRFRSALSRAKKQLSTINNQKKRV